MNFTIGLKKNFNDTEVEPVWLARGQVTLQIRPINFFSLAFRSHGALRKYKSFLQRGQQNNTKTLF